MTKRVLAVGVLSMIALSAWAIDITKLPAMDNYGWKQVVELRGRHLEAIDTALHQFREDRFSTSGDLKRFSVTVHSVVTRLLSRLLLSTTQRAVRDYRAVTSLVRISHTSFRCVRCDSSATTSSVTKSSNKAMQLTTARHVFTLRIITTSFSLSRALSAVVADLVSR